jgi:hypothetical protein
MSRVLILAFLELFNRFAAGDEMRHIQETPRELVGIGVTFEKVDFRFNAPHRARFWIEGISGREKPAIEEVPHDQVEPANHYILVYVESGDGAVQLTVRTDTPEPLSSRTGCLGPIAMMDDRDTTYLPKDSTVPLDRDIEVFEARGWSDDRHPGRPMPMVRIWARFAK